MSDANTRQKAEELYYGALDLMGDLPKNRDITGGGDDET